MIVNHGCKFRYANIVQGQLTASIAKGNVKCCLHFITVYTLKILFHNVGKQKGHDLGIQMIKYQSFRLYALKKVYSGF